MYFEQITSGEISIITYAPDHVHIDVMSVTEQGTFVTWLRLGATNYKMKVGDTISWSANFGGEFSNCAWWSTGADLSFPRSLWLEGVEHQRRIT